MYATRSSNSLFVFFLDGSGASLDPVSRGTLLIPTSRRALQSSL
jgi:hypothetical protein